MLIKSINLWGKKAAGHLSCLEHWDSITSGMGQSVEMWASSGPEIVKWKVSTRAGSKPSRSLNFTITEKASTRAFSSLKVLDNLSLTYPFWSLCWWPNPNNWILREPTFPALTSTVGCLKHQLFVFSWILSLMADEFVIWETRSKQLRQFLACHNVANTRLSRAW